MIANSSTIKNFLVEIHVWEIGEKRKKLLLQKRMRPFQPIRTQNEGSIRKKTHRLQINCTCLRSPAPSPPPLPRFSAADKYDPHLTALVSPQLSFILHIINISSVKKKTQRRRWKILTTSLQSISTLLQCVLVSTQYCRKDLRNFHHFGTIDRHIRNTCKKGAGRLTPTKTPKKNRQTWK